LSFQRSSELLRPKDVWTIRVRLQIEARTLSIGAEYEPPTDVDQAGIVTLASFTCQWRDALMGRTQRNQWLAEFESGTGHLENPLFLADVTMPSGVQERPLAAERLP